MTELFARHAIGSPVSGAALVARDGFSARYDLDRARGTFSRPAHQLAGQERPVQIPPVAPDELATGDDDDGARGWTQRLAAGGFAARSLGA